MSLPVDDANQIGQDAIQHRSRDYQLEMYEESMKGNIIVAMDTGSGKTHIAILRITAELDRCPPEKLVWFLAPTVALCTQQLNVINLAIPAARTRLLIGSDNVDRWSEQRIWDVALKDIQIVVSTPQVLADALSHGFVTMAKLALLIFDEAHHCTGGHAANKIMHDFYHPTVREQGQDATPHILGLTASPIVRSKPGELQTIEANLDSISKTPRKNRPELLKYVHRPALWRLSYLQHDSTLPYNSRLLQRLISVFQNLDIRRDPYILKLREEPSNRPILEKTLLTGKTFCSEQLKKFTAKAIHIYEELGQWAADYFIVETIQELKKTIDSQKGLFIEWENDEKVYLLSQLSHVASAGTAIDPTLSESSQISAKLESLISFLTRDEQREVSGVVFVRQRATVSVLSKLLAVHPRTRHRFRCAPFVGLSNSASKKNNIGELLDLRAQSETLDDFRVGRKNLVIATDVLEEGIDITACHLVICFDKPPNLKSFVQRRGRARQEKSTFAIMLASDDRSGSIENWQQLEEEMVRTYQSEDRVRLQISELESIEENDMQRFRVESTGALLTIESAMAHLYHFCAVLPHQAYVDLRPAFTFTEEGDTRLINATVILPNCVNSLVRRIRGDRWWRTERAAMKDAAFKAYIALYRAGLLNDNLLPLTNERAVDGDVPEEAPSTIDVQEQFNPWVGLAKTWASPDVNQTTISIDQEGEGTYLMTLTTPLAIPTIPSFTLHWNSKTTFTIRTAPPLQVPEISPESLQLMGEIMHTLLRSTHSDHKPDDRKDFVIIFTPSIVENQLGNWLAKNRGRRSAQEDFLLNHNVSPDGLVRSSIFSGIPHIFYRWHTHPPDEGDSEVECLPLPKRRNFLHRNTLSNKSIDSNDQENVDSMRKSRMFPVSSCTIDLLPFKDAQMSLFIPAISQHLEILLIAGQLRETILEEVPLKDISHVITAICASSAQWVTDYQRYEFLGDSVLKLIVSTQLFIEHKNWHEGYLSENRNRLVSNSRLARAAVDKGLDAFIVTKPFLGKHWTPPLISQVLAQPPGNRTVSSKVLADVVEALIGAALLDGGFSVARTCIHTFLPSISSTSPVFSRSARPSNANVATALITKAELLVGYQFQDKSLFVEALTHPSCDRDITTESYQRLEFLGDAVLDMVVVSTIFKHNQTYSHGDMTLMKAALVNADFLAFLCLELSITQDTVNIQETPDGKFCTVPATEEIAFWKFMHHNSQEVTKAQQACLERHQHLRGDILACLSDGNSYPWVLLAQLNADKFFSDIIESLFGAIFVDTNGDLEACELLAERIGIMAHLRRMLAGGIDIAHPKTSLGQLAGPDGVEYVVKPGDGAPGVYECLVRVGDVDVAAVGGCLTKNEAVVRAADAAVRVMSARKRSHEEMS